MLYPAEGPELDELRGLIPGQLLFFFFPSSLDFYLVFSLFPVSTLPSIVLAVRDKTCVVTAGIARSLLS